MCLKFPGEREERQRLVFSIFENCLLSLKQLFFIITTFTMANELDKLFSSMKEQQEKKKEEQRQVWRKQNAFIAGFKKSLDKIIHPAMLGICSQLRKKDCYALSLSRRREKSNRLPHIKEFVQPPKIDAEGQFLYKHYESYYIAAPALAEGMAFILTVLGNYSLQKVCVFAEYVKHHPNAPSTSVKKTEEQYELAQLTPELFDTIVAARMKEMLAIKQQADENKPPL